MNITATGFAGVSHVHSGGIGPLLQPGHARHDVERASDLRRRHARALVERLLRLGAALPEAERALIEAVYRDGMTVKQLAVIRGDDPKALRRRVRRLVARVMSAEFRYVAARRSELPRTRARVAELCVLRGMSLRGVAGELGLSLHMVRRHRDAVMAMAEIEEARGRAGRADSEANPARHASPVNHSTLGPAKTTAPGRR